MLYLSIIVMNGFLRVGQCSRVVLQFVPRVGEQSVDPVGEETPDTDQCLDHTQQQCSNQTHPVITELVSEIETFHHLIDQLRLDIRCSTVKSTLGRTYVEQNHRQLKLNDLTNKTHLIIIT